MEPASRKRYWFYAKRYGYGWGLPATWEGWVVFIAYLGGVFGGIAVYPPDTAMAEYLVLVAVLTALLIIICYLKGEPARWRWGDASDADSKGCPAAGRAPNRGMMLATHLLLGPVILGIAVFFRIYPPAEINHTYGYRTATSMSSQEAWREAQVYNANLMIVAGVALVFYQVISAMLMRPALSLATSVILLLLAVFAVLPLTEAHLKGIFDVQGRRIAQPMGNL